MYRIREVGDVTNCAVPRVRLEPIQHRGGWGGKEEEERDEGRGEGGGEEEEDIESLVLCLTQSETHLVSCDRVTPCAAPGNHG